MSNSYFMPAPEEISVRAEIVQWMGMMNWPSDVMDAVMLNDNPCVEHVRRLVYRYGPIKALQLIQQFNTDIPIKRVY